MKPATPVINQVDWLVARWVFRVWYLFGMVLFALGLWIPGQARDDGLARDDWFIRDDWFTRDDGVSWDDWVTSNDGVK
jgi:hypothetical protein